jgi:hypothetical protein
MYIIIIIIIIIITIIMTGVRKWFGLTPFAAIILTMGWVQIPAISAYSLDMSIHRCHCFWQLPDGCAEPLFSCVAMPLTGSRRCSSPGPADGPYPVEHRQHCGPVVSLRKPLITDGVTPSSYRNHVIRLCPSQSPSNFLPSSMRFDHWTG